VKDVTSSGRRQPRGIGRRAGFQSHGSPHGAGPPPSSCGEPWRPKGSGGGKGSVLSNRSTPRIEILGWRPLSLRDG